MEATTQQRGLTARFEDSPTQVGEERKMSDFNLGNEQGSAGAQVSPQAPIGPQLGIGVGGAAAVYSGVPQEVRVQPGRPQSGGAQVATLDKVVSDSRVTEEALRKAKLEQLKREQREQLKEAEKAEREHVGGGESIAQLWNDAIKEVAKVYNEGEEISGLKRVIYDFIEKVTFGKVNMYAREANAMLNTARKKANRIKKRLDFIYKKLYKPSGRNKGLAVVLEEEKGIATAHANSLVKTKQSIEEYNLEIARLEGEIAKIDQDVQGNPGFDYSEDKALKVAELAGVREEYRGFERDKRNMSNKLERYNVRIKSKKAIVTAVNMVYSKGTKAYEDLDSQVQIAQEYINQGKVIGVGLLEAVNDLDQVVEATKELVEVEDIMGRSVADAARRVTEKMENVEEMTGDKAYLEELEIETNEDEQKLNDRTDTLIKEYATIAYK